MRKVSDVDYIVATPDHRKQNQLCHVNMFKGYHDETVPEQSVTTLPVCSLSSEKRGGAQESDSDDRDDSDEDLDDTGVTLNNSQVLKDLSSKLQHLAESEHIELEKLIFESIALFHELPSRTTMLYHDVDVGTAQPVKQIIV